MVGRLLGGCRVPVLTSTNVFQGVFTETGCGDEVDHAVVVVGYGSLLLHNGDENEEHWQWVSGKSKFKRNTKTTEPYWLIRNSWGATWGEGGYMKLARISIHQNGTCGILSYPTRPFLLDERDNDLE